MILAGQGIGWLPKSVIEEELRHNTLQVLPEATAVLELDVVLVRKSVAGSPLMHKIWEITAEGPGFGMSIS